MTSFEGSGGVGDDQGLVAPDNEATLGRALVQRRLHLSLGPVDAATTLGVSRSTYVAYEHDERRLTPDALRGVALFLDVSLAKVLEYYGTTCVAQARRSLLRAPQERSTPTARAPRTGVGRRTKVDEMMVVKRVFFDDPTSPPDVSDGTTAASATLVDPDGVGDGRPGPSRGPEEPVSNRNGKKKPKKKDGATGKVDTEKKGAKKKGKKKGGVR